MVLAVCCYLLRAVLDCSCCIWMSVLVDCCSFCVEADCYSWDFVVEVLCCVVVVVQVSTHRLVVVERCCVVMVDGSLVDDCHAVCQLVVAVLSVVLPPFSADHDGSVLLTPVIYSMCQHPSETNWHRTILAEVSFGNL